MMITSFSLFLRVVVLLAMMAGLCACTQNTTPEKSWQYDPNGILSTQLSVHGKYAAIGSMLGYAEVWDIASNSRITLLQHQQQNSKGIIALSFSENEQYMISAESDTLAWWKLPTGKALGFWQFKNIKTVALSAQGRFAFISQMTQEHGYPVNKLTYFDLQTEKVIAELYHAGVINSISLSNNGRYVLTGADDKRVRLWDLKQVGKKRLVREWLQPEKINYVLLSPSARYALSSASYSMQSAKQGMVKLWDTKTGKLVKTLGGQRILVSAAAFSQDEKTIVTGLSTGILELWNIKTKKRLQSWQVPRKTFWRPTLAHISQIVFDHSGLIISLSSQGLGQRWRINTQ